MKTLMSTLLLIVVLFSPGVLVYFIQDHPYNYIIFLGVFVLSIIIHLLFAKKLGWKMDKEIKKQHSW
jgi:hypothetical protein